MKPSSVSEFVDHLQKQARHAFARAEAAAALKLARAALTKGLLRLQWAGGIVFTCTKGLPGVGFSRPEWNEIKGMKSGKVKRNVTEDFLPGGPCERTIIYEAPFDRCDREQDYTTVWKEFESRDKNNVAASTASS